MPIELLQELFQQGRVDQLDVDICKSFAPSKILGLYLSRAFRAGFMSVEVGEKCTPSVEIIFLDDTMQAPSKELGEVLEKAIVEEFRAKRFPPECIKADGPKVSFPYAQAIENSIVTNIKKIACAQPDVCLDEKKIPQILDCSSLHPDQRKAVEILLTTSCGFLTGGPGTGKTLTAGVWLEALKKSALSPVYVGLAAPTGRAAKTLAASLQKTFGENASFDVQTIHRLILSPFSHVPYNVLIVDECSMIDSALFAKLLKVIRPGTRVLFLGDKDQLPPIDPGQPFAQLLTSFPQGAKKAHLSVSFRTESKEILEVARAFLQGEPSRKHTGAVSYFNIKELGTLIEKFIVEPWERATTLNDANAALKDTILLTPTRVGPLGTQEINRFVHFRRKKNSLTPVVFLKNNHELGVMNGDLGILEKGHPLEHIYSLELKIPAAICPQFEEAYAMSVHKSQGSEFYRVILVLPPHAIFTPNLLYTAATRARGELIIVSENYPTSLICAYN